MSDTRSPSSLRDVPAAPYNPRAITDPAAFGLKESLYTFGDLSGVVLNAATGHIICAHQRRDGLVDLDISTIRWGRHYTVTLGFRGQRFLSRERDGWATLPDGARFRVRQVTWPDPFERAANLTANNPHIAGDWTADAPALLHDLRRTLPDLVMEELRFDALADDFAALPGLPDEPADGLTDPDAVPPAPADPITRPGDLWHLGPHRLLCGDSTKPEDVARLMGGKRAVALLTDPPYGMGESRMRDGGDSTKPNKASDWDGETFDISKLPVKEYKTLIWGAQWYGGKPMELGLMTWSCWDKKTYEMGAVPHGALELCCANFGKSHVWSIMWGPYQSKRQDIDHPTAKPVELIAETVEMATVKGEIVHDPFLGSGTTLIACEQLGRRCYAMEIEPKYCDVAVRRWEEFTGRKATRD